MLFERIREAKVDGTNFEVSRDTCPFQVEMPVTNIVVLFQLMNE